MLLIASGIVIVIFAAGIRIVPPTKRGVIERLGKYHRFLHVGFNWIIPIIDKSRYRNITERMTNIESQEIITKDNLNAKVELVYARHGREFMGCKSPVHESG
jgi:regulator of protease activity HflC (stomatin/prohibitin superfamily)